MKKIGEVGSKAQAARLKGGQFIPWSSETWKEGAKMDMESDWFGNRNVGVSCLKASLYLHEVGRRAICKPRRGTLKRGFRENVKGHRVIWLAKGQ